MLSLPPETTENAWPSLSKCVNDSTSLIYDIVASIFNLDLLLKFSFVAII